MTPKRMNNTELKLKINYSKILFKRSCYYWSSWRNRAGTIRGKTNTRINYFIGLFLDIGNLWGVDYDSSLDGSNKIRSTAGVNTQWLSPVGPMSFIFARNITKASTDVTQGFKFQLGTTF